MTRLLKRDVQRRSEEIKNLILSGKAFEEKLYKLYTDLRLQARHEWLVETYHFLCLYTPQEKINHLYHPALLQALISTGNLAQARQISCALLARDPQNPDTCKLTKGLGVRGENLPAYTPLAALSRYAPQLPVRRPSKKATSRILPATWEQILPHITPAHLDALGYYTTRKCLLRAPQKYRKMLLDNLDELMLNYLFQYHRMVVVATGSLLEILLAMHLQEKCHVHKITHKGKDSKNIWQASLYELIHFYAAKQLLPPSVIHLCKAARLQRNFIHPGKEITAPDALTPSGAQICFLAALEVINCLL